MTLWGRTIRRFRRPGASAGPPLARVPDGDHLRAQLVQLLGRPVTAVEILPQRWGTTASLLAVVVHEGNGREFPLVLKVMLDEAYWEFYRAVLAPFELGSPQIYGIVESRGLRFLVMERITPLKTLPLEQKFRAAVTWLARKDRAVLEHFATVARAPGVRRRAGRLGVGESLQILRLGAGGPLPEQLAAPFLDLVEVRRDALRKLEDELLHGTPLTINHGDFHLGNVLISAAAGRESVYVVDWEPSIDSVLVDLARLVRDASPGLRHSLLGFYADQVLVPCFEERFAHAELLVAIHLLADFVRALMNGEAHLNRGEITARVGAVRSLITQIH